MKRTLRSAASKSDAENEPSPQLRKKSTADSKPQRNRKDKVVQQNKENVTTRRNKNVRKDVVQPLQERNPVAVDEQNNKIQMANSSMNISESKKLHSKIISTSMTVIKDSEENIVTQPNKRRANHSKPPVPSTETETVSSVTTRKRKQSKDIPSKDGESPLDRERSTGTAGTVVVASDSAEKAVSRVNTTTMKPLVPFTVKTRSKIKPTASPIHRTNRRQLGKQKSNATTTSPSKPIISSTLATKSTKRNKAKTSDASERKKPSQPVPKLKSNLKPPPTSPRRSNVDSAKFVTTRKNRRNIQPPQSENVNTSKAKEPEISNVTRRQAKAPKDNKPTVKASTISNVTTRQPKAINDEKSRAKESTITNVTTRRLEVAIKVDKSKANESVIANVTTRRRATTKPDCSDNPKPVKVSNNISRNKRSQSVHNAIYEKQMDTNSNAKDVSTIVSPRRKQKTADKTDAKTDGKVTKQPELLVNRSTASDSSDQSNGSALPIYKRGGNGNNNTVESVFDFESNSQENTLDEEMQEVVARLVRENKVSVIKKKKGKGVTKAKTNVTRSKKIEKIRSDLKELQILNVRATKIIPKPQLKTSSYVEKNLKTTQNNASVVDLVDAGSSNETSVEPLQNNEIPLEEERHSAIDDTMDDVVIDIDHVEDNATFQKPLRPLQLATTSNETPPRQCQITYTGPKQANTALYQSTPVRTENPGNSSPWRYNQGEVTYGGNAFSRYSELEKSPIKSDITKTAIVMKSPMKSPIKKQSLPLATKPISNNFLQVIDKPTTLVSDLRNGFGFFDEDDDNEYEGRPSLPSLDCSTIPSKPTSPKKPALPKKLTSSGIFTSLLPQTFNSIRETVRKLRNTQQPPPPADVFNPPKPKTQSKISSHFGDRKMSYPSKPSTSKGNKLFNKNKVETTTTTTRTKEISQTETATTSYLNNDACSLLFEDTIWPEDKPHRSYSRVTKRDHKRQHDYKSIIADDESEFGDTVAHKRTKRSKPKDEKHEEELKQFEEEMKSQFMDVENFELIMEKSA